MNDNIYYQALLEKDRSYEGTFNSDFFKSIVGISPKQSKDQQIVDLCRLETPLGTMIACATEQGVCLLEFTDRKMLETELKTLARLMNAHLLQGENPHFLMLKTQLQEYFRGERKEFSVPLFSPGTAFQQEVWNALKTIPYGKTRSYLQQAISINKPTSVRAVANANGMNRLCILIPCHRVIGTNGTLTGFGGGLWRKKWLLELEEAIPKELF